MSDTFNDLFGSDYDLYDVLGGIGSLPNIPVSDSLRDIDLSGTNIFNSDNDLYDVLGLSNAIAPGSGWADVNLFNNGYDLYDVLNNDSSGFDISDSDRASNPTISNSFGNSSVNDISDSGGTGIDTFNSDRMSNPTIGGSFGNDVSGGGGNNSGGVLQTVGNAIQGALGGADNGGAANAALLYQLIKALMKANQGETANEMDESAIQSVTSAGNIAPVRSGTLFGVPSTHNVVSQVNPVTDGRFTLGLNRN